MGPRITLIIANKKTDLIRGDYSYSRAKLLSSFRVLSRISRATIRARSKSADSWSLLLQLRVLEEPHRFVLEVSKQLELISEMRIEGEAGRWD